MGLPRRETIDRVRAGAGVLLALGFAVAASRLWVRILEQMQSPLAASAARSFTDTMERFEALRASLPATGAVGYANEALLGGGRRMTPTEVETAQHEARIAQYVLAPLRLQVGTEARFVIANCLDADGLAAFDAYPGLVRRREVGERTALYENLASGDAR